MKTNGEIIEKWWKDKFVKKRYKDVSAGILTMMLVDIDKLLSQQKQEIVESVKNTMTEWESVTDIDNPASIVDLKDEIIERLTLIK